jgi:hypothetical protein
VKFSDVVRGTRARKRVSIDIGGDPVEIDLRPLNVAEEAGVLERARAFAKASGVDAPREGDPIYDLALATEIIAIGCVDPESSETDPKPFFDVGASQIRASKLLSREHVLYLAELQAIHQEACSPFRRTVPAEDLFERAKKIADGDPDPFVELPPQMRWLFTRGLASLLLTSLLDKSLSGSLSPPPEENEPADDEDGVE